MNWRNPLLAIGCVMIASPLLAKAVVVRSAGPSAKVYPPGKALPDSAKISLKPGDSVTVLGPGSTKTLRGPGVFPAASAGAEGLKMAAARRTRFGAMRSRGAAAISPSPWNLDISQSGTVCLADGGPPTMWRPSSEDAVKLNITSAGKTTTVNWPAAEASIDWPTSLPVAEGADYQLAIVGGPTPETVRFVKMAAIPADAVDAAQALIERGCQNQLDVLVDSLDQAE